MKQINEQPIRDEQAKAERLKKMRRIRAELEAGTYNVSSSDVATAILATLEKKSDDRAA